MLLPGLESGDEICILPSDSDDVNEKTCPLTFEPFSSFNTKNFFLDLHEMLFVTSNNRKRVRMDLKLANLIENMSEEPAVAHMDTCKHSFSLFPFLFHVMTSSAGFRCPICRHGSGNIMSLDRTIAFDQIKPTTWQCLCELAKLHREKSKHEEALEEMNQLLELQMQEINAINNMSVQELLHEINVSVLFSIYSREQRTSRSSSPSINIPVNLRPDLIYSMTAPTFVSTESIPMVYQSGQALRPLSTMLRHSSFFLITLCAQTEDGEFAFFQSPRLEIPKSNNQALHSQTITCTSGLNGQVYLRWDLCPVDDVMILRNISYETVCSNIRQIRLQTLNGME